MLAKAEQGQNTGSNIYNSRKGIQTEHQFCYQNEKIARNSINFWPGKKKRIETKLRRNGISILKNPLSPLFSLTLFLQVISQLAAF